jgi:hypothetical protein
VRYLWAQSQLSARSSCHHDDDRHLAGDVLGYGLLRRSTVIGQGSETVALIIARGPYQEGAA